MLFVLDPDPLNGGKKGEEKAREVARVVGVEHLLDVPFVGLSNGQTRRARMALALLLDPKFLVIEERMSLLVLSVNGDHPWIHCSVLLVA